MNQQKEIDDARKLINKLDWVINTRPQCGTNCRRHPCPTCQGNAAIIEFYEKHGVCRTKELIDPAEIGEIE